MQVFEEKAKKARKATSTQRARTTAAVTEELKFDQMEPNRIFFFPLTSGTGRRSGTRVARSPRGRKGIPKWRAGNYLGLQADRI